MKVVRITLLTQEHCAFCDQAKAILARLALEYGFSITMTDVRSPEGSALASHSGMLFPPGILLDGESFTYGRLSEHKLRRELDRRLRGEKT